MNRKGVFPKGGCLIFFGDIFGGRFHENYHQIIDYDFDKVQGIFRISFNEDETCVIHNPEGITYGKTTFIIKEASRIKWRWYYYGRERIIENLNCWDFEKIDNTLVLKTETGNLSIGSGKTTFYRMNHPALQFM